MDEATRTRAQALVECWHALGDAIVSLRSVSGGRNQHGVNQDALQSAHRALVDAHTHHGRAAGLPVQLPVLLPDADLAPSESGLRPVHQASLAKRTLTHQRALVWAALEELSRREAAPALLAVEDRVPALSPGRSLALRAGPVGYVVVPSAILGLGFDAGLRDAWPAVAFAMIVGLGMIAAWHRARDAQQAEILSGTD